MSYKRISVRFNMDVDAERKAWEIIHEKGNGLVGKEVINAINTSSELSGLEKIIRRVVSEELKKVRFIPSEPAACNPETEESETDILTFLETFNGANLEPFFLAQTIGGSKPEPLWNGGENDMEKEKRALSWWEFVESGFDGREYQFPDFEGTFAATIACKRWDRNKNLLAYLDFDDERKIMTSAWIEKNYLGLADIPLNTRVSVSFQFSAKGVSYLRSVEGI